jgi:hypothetical protein
VIRLKLNCSAISKPHLFKGAKGVYLDVTLIETPADKYGNDFVAVQDLGKEARERGEKGPILGNAKVYAPRAKTEAKTAAPSAQTRPAQEKTEDPIPF